MGGVTLAGRPGTRRPGSATLLLLGPALVASAAYVDPGNVATNTAAGATYGHLLVWVVVGANVMAGLVQYLAAKLGVVTGASLPEVLRDRMSRPVRWAYWAQAEVVTMATDLAEVLGGAIALHLLFDLPLLWGGVITAGVSMLILRLGGQGRPQGLQTAVLAMLAVVCVGFVAGVVVDPPAAGDVAGGLVPRLDGAGSLLLVAGMLGATVMPHAVYAHSALAAERHGRPAAGRPCRSVLAATRVDVAVALAVAGTVNLALLLLGAGALAGDERSATVEGVHAALGDTLGGGVAVLFAVGLLFSGLASTVVGCYSGGVVMGGLLRVRVPVLVRRAVTAVPALVVLGLGTSPTTVLLVSQMVLSFGIPFAIVPLVLLTSRRSVMGADVNRRVTVVAAAVICAAVVAVNLALLAMALGPA